MGMSIFRALQRMDWIYERNINTFGNSAFAQFMFDGYDNVFGRVRKVKMFVLYSHFPVLFVLIISLTIYARVDYDGGMENADYVSKNAFPEFFKSYPGLI